MFSKAQKINKYYTYIATSRLLDLVDNTDLKIYLSILSFTGEQIKKNNPEIQKLVDQAGKQNLNPILGLEKVKSVENAAKAFADWMKTQGVDISDAERKKKLAFITGDLKDINNTSKNIVFTVFLYFDLI